MRRNIRKQKFKEKHNCDKSNFLTRGWWYNDYDEKERKKSVVVEDIRIILTNTGRQ